MCLAGFAENLYLFTALIVGHKGICLNEYLVHTKFAQYCQVTGFVNGCCTEFVLVSLNGLLPYPANEIMRKLHRFLATTSAFAVGAGLVLGGPAAKAADASLPTVPATFTIKGSGFGHGVGMSQYGAQGMALAGKPYAEILSHYYPTTALAANPKLANPPVATNVRVGLLQGVKYVALRGEALGGTAGKLTVTSTGWKDAAGADSTSALTVAANSTSIVIRPKVGSSTVTEVLKPNGTNPDGSTKFLLLRTTAANTPIKVAWQVAGHPSVVNVSDGYSLANAYSGLGNFCVNVFGSVQPTATGTCPHRYRYGSIDVSLAKISGTTYGLAVVNTLRLADEYINGLGEVPSSWNAEALKAQAVAARSYALAGYQQIITTGTALTPPGGTATKVHSDCWCHLYSSPNKDQNFVGFSKEYSSYGSAWVAAVTSTMGTSPDGQILTYRVGSTTKVVKAFFFSASGGWTQPASEVWGSGELPWSQKVDDHWALLPEVGNSNLVWTKTIDQATLVKQLNCAGHNSNNVCVTAFPLPVKNVVALYVTGRTSSKATSRLTVADSAGNVQQVNVVPGTYVSPSSLRTLLGYQPTKRTLPSTYITAITPSSSTVTADADALAVKPTETSITTTPTSPMLPSDVTYAGTVSPVQFNDRVYLQELVATKWVTIAQTVTNIYGRWSTSWPAVPPGTHTVRIVLGNAAGNIVAAQPNLVSSGQITLRGPKTAVHSTKGKTPASNNKIRVSGTVLPVTEGASVLLFTRTPTTKWVRIAILKTNVKGTYVFTFNAPIKKGTVMVLARTKDPRLGSIATPTLAVTIK